MLKRERIKRKIYITRQDAHGDVLDYINDQLPPVEFEKRNTASLESV